MVDRIKIVEEETREQGAPPEEVNGAGARESGGEEEEQTQASQEPAQEAVEEQPSLEEQLVRKETEVAELQTKILYLHAELENFKKRTEKRYRDALEYAAEPLLRELLSVLDNLERAVDHGQESGPEGHEAMLEGLGHVIQQFTDVMRCHGVEPVAAEGEKFDPGLHEAMLQVPGEEDGKVADVYEKGYTLKGRLLRPAKVTVTKVAPGEGDD